MNKIKKVFFFSNGNTGTFDEQGIQIPELQESWFRLYIKFLKETGYTDNELNKIDFIFPHGTHRQYT